MPAPPADVGNRSIDVSVVRQEETRERQLAQRTLIIFIQPVIAERAGQMSFAEIGPKPQRFFRLGQRAHPVRCRGLKFLINIREAGREPRPRESKLRVQIDRFRVEPGGV